MTGVSSKMKRWKRILLFVLMGLVLAGAIFWIKKGSWRFTLSIVERRIEAGQPVYLCDFSNNTTSSIIYLGPFARPASSLRGTPPSGIPNNGNWQTLEPGQKVRLSANVTTADGKPFDGRAAVAMVVIEMPAAMQVPAMVHGWLPADWHLAKSMLIVTEPKAQ